MTSAFIGGGGGDHGHDPHENQTRRGMVLQRILFCPAEERTARELHSMDKDQRQQVWADMSGHAAAIDYRMHAESPELIQERLQLMEEELTRVQQEHHHQRNHLHLHHEAASSSSTTTSDTISNIDGREAYHRAVQQDAAWVQEQKIKFLRAEDFDPAGAAARMIRFFAWKEHLFGPQALGRDLTLVDDIMVNAEDIESLRAGGVQFLSQRDHAGRGIIFTRTMNYKYKVRENQLRAIFYMSQAATQDERSQKVGYLSVSYNVGGYPPGGYDFELTRQVNQLVKALPIRFCGIYLCFSTSAWKPVADLISHMLSPLLRVRLRSIQGSHQECLYQLYALGIPIDTIPLNNQGENRLEHHLAFLERQKQREQQKQQKQQQLQQQKQQHLQLH